MKSHILLCVSACLAGAICMALWQSITPPHPTSPAPLPSTEKSALVSRTNAPAQEGLRRNSSSDRFSLLASDPYLSLTPEEITALGQTVDLRRRDAWRMLNSIMNPGLRKSVWEAAFRANLDQLSYPELTEITLVARGTFGQELASQIYEKIRREDAGFLETPEGISFLSRTLYAASLGAGDYKDLLAILPKRERHNPFFVDTITLHWLRRVRTPDALREVVALYTAESRTSAINLSNPIDTLWNGSDRDTRMEVVTTIGQLPGAERNRQLIQLAAHKSTTAEDLSTVLAAMTSYSAQQESVRKWMNQKQHTGTDLAEALSSRSDSSLRRITGFLRSMPETSGSR